MAQRQIAFDRVADSRFERATVHARIWTPKLEGATFFQPEITIPTNGSSRPLPPSPGPQ